MWIVQAMPHDARHGNPMGLYLYGIAWKIPLKVAWQMELSTRNAVYKGYTENSATLHARDEKPARGQPTLFI